MGEGTSIINLGELSKPATVLIEKISEAVGGFCRPWQIKRVAQTEAEAAMIEAKSQMKLTELHQRALRRFLDEEARKQQNIENITASALEHLDDKAKPEGMDDDWIANFFDKCRIVSDAEMQTLWGKVLAGEANAPGKYTKRTVSFLNTLDKEDASLFRRLCGFCWEVRPITPLVYDLDNAIYRGADLGFGLLNHLESIGLITFDELRGFVRTKIQKREVMSYYGEKTILEFPKEEENQLRAGQVLLTEIGRQLAPICGAEPVPGFREFVLQRWSEEGIVLSSPYPRSGVQPN